MNRVELMRLKESCLGSSTAHRTFLLGSGNSGALTECVVCPGQA